MGLSELEVNLVVNDEVRGAYLQEHGLLLYLNTSEGSFIFDTGQGGAALENLRDLALDPRQARAIILSHGHYDHTGGLASLLDETGPLPVYYHPYLTGAHYRVEPNDTRDISMPPLCRAALQWLPIAYRRPINQPTAIAPGFLLSGPIPRRSGEDVGGPFFFDRQGIEPDTIPDEQSLMATLASGEKVLFTGCCHAGVINTLEYFKTLGENPSYLFGGLHLKNASEERLTRTAQYLNQSSLKAIFLFHCTGSAAISFLSEHFQGKTYSLIVPDQVRFSSSAFGELNLTVRRVSFGKKCSLKETHRRDWCLKYEEGIRSGSLFYPKEKNEFHTDQ